MHRKDFSAYVSEYEITLNQSNSDHFEATLNVIDGVIASAERGGLVQRRVPRQLRDHWYTRLAAALSKYLSLRKSEVSEQQVIELVKRKQAIVSIFAASGFGNTSHLSNVMAYEATPEEVKIDNASLIMLYAVLGIDDVTDNMMQAALTLPTHWLFPLMLGWLSQRMVLTEQGERNRTQLLASSRLIQDAEVKDDHTIMMWHCWMYCSYASYAGKHDIKEVLNDLFRKRLKNFGVRTPLIKPKMKKRPRLLVIHEWFKSGHAMFRCYAPMITSLKNEFHLVALANVDDIDQASERIFEEIITIDISRQPFGDILRAVQSVKADIIFYPSVGMAMWVILLANLRLAPVQIAALGHPATTRSKAIDYIIENTRDEAIESLYSERVLCLESPVNHHPHPKLPASLPRRSRGNDGIVHVAVHSKVMKLSYRLLDICVELRQRSKFPIKFIFFPGESGIYMDGLVRGIKNRLPEAEVLPTLTYPSLLGHLVNCDLALAAFPFGNTNSTVDSCILGIPTVAHFGIESPARSDRDVLARAGLPEWLWNKSDREYFDAALRLINDEELRKKVKAQMQDADIQKRLFWNGEADHGKSISDLFLSTLSAK